MPTVIRSRVVISGASHGTHYAYSKLGCRCATCTEAHRVRQLRLQKQRLPLAEDDPRHGRHTSYTNYGCRCDACRGAKRAYDAARRERLRAAGPNGGAA